MGYYSEVAVCLRTKDLKDMVKKAIAEYNMQDCPRDRQKFYYICKIIIDGFYNDYKAYKPDEDMNKALNNVLTDINETSEFTVLQWSGIKWYHDFYDVAWFRKHMEEYDYYEEVEIGEDGACEENRSDEGCDYYNIEAVHTIEVRV